MADIELLYNIIWNVIDITSLTVGEIIGVFEEIKYELIKNAKETLENDTEFNEGT